MLPSASRNGGFRKMTDYYPNRTGECFTSSLANLLLYQFGDERSAQRVFEGGRQHPLILPDGGTLIQAWPFLAGDLTQGRYDARLYARFSSVYGLLRAPSQIPNIPPDVIPLYQQAIWHSVWGMIDNSGHYAGPSPILLSLDLAPETPGQRGHVIIECGNGHFIDNGRFGKGDLSGYTIKGILRVERSQQTG